MNNFYSPPVEYRKRWITSQMQSAAADHPVIVLTGARQVGKSTLLLNAEPFRTWRFYSMDDFDVLRQAYQDPEALWSGTDCIILDEVQKAPEVLTAVKKAVDRNPGSYHFALSGSANLLLMQQVSESLAGRAVYFVLDPMTLGEAHGNPPVDILDKCLSADWPDDSTLPDEPVDLASLLLQGCMPPVLSLPSPQSWVRWWEGYVSTYLERDLRQVSQIDSLLDFRRIMQLAALRSAQVFNQSEVARDARVSQPTVHRYMNILETTHLFERLPAFTASHTTRQIKSPKAFWNDSGLAVFLSGYYDLDSLRQARELGAYFETLVYHHLRVLTRLMTPSGRMYYLRQQDGTEVDFVVEHGRRFLAVEVKQTRNPSFHDTVGLQKFLAQNPGASGGLLVHSGRHIMRLGKNILALPWTVLAGSAPPASV